MKNILILILILCVSVACGAELKTIQVYSESMDKDIPVSIYFPQSYFSDYSTRYPVLYALNGLGGDHLSMAAYYADIMRQFVDEHNFIIVIPFNGLRSWYFDNPKTNEMYETFTSKELIDYIDLRYRTKSDKKHRAICGGSMGGHGALYLGVYHPDKYSVVGSFAAVADLNCSKGDKEIYTKTGARKYEDCMAINNAQRFKEANLALYIDVGVYDYLYDCNKVLHKNLLDAGVKHVYTERFGAHDGDFMREAWVPFLDFLLNEMKKNE